MRVFQTRKSVFLPLFLMAWATAFAATGQGMQPDANPRWFAGTLSFRGDTIPLRLKLSESSVGLTAQLDLPELVYAWEPAPVSGTLEEFELELPFGIGHFTLRGREAQQTVHRVLGDSEMVLSLERTRAPGFATRPVTFAGAGVRLAGALVLPPGPGPHPAIVLAHGAGAQGRESWNYRSWADVFVRLGIAVLFYDKRGVGESTGETWDADLSVLAEDLEAAVDHLGGVAAIDAARIGIMAHSQGAWLATLVASRNGTVSYLVLGSAPAMDPLAQKLVRVEHEMRAAEFSDQDIRAAMDYMRGYSDVVRTGDGWPELKIASSRTSGQPWADYVNQPEEEWHLGWYRSNSTVDPVPLWEQLEIPVLALYGTADLIVPPSVHAERLTSALRKGGSDVELRVFDGADHRLETPMGNDRTGRWRWFRIAPGLLDVLRDWLDQQVIHRVAGEEASGAQPHDLLPRQAEAWEQVPRAPRADRVPVGDTALAPPAPVFDVPRPTRGREGMEQAPPVPRVDPEQSGCDPDAEAPPAPGA